MSVSNLTFRPCPIRLSFHSRKSFYINPANLPHIFHCCMNTKYDAIVVGARIAGGIVATLLAEQGYNILVLDRARFPSDSLSTHFFRSPTFRALKQVGVFDDAVKHAPRLVNNFNDLDGNVFTEPVIDSEGPSYYLCIRRITLDTLLYHRMRQEQCATVYEGAVVTDVFSESGRVAGVTWRQGDEEHRSSARVVIGADGVRSVVAASVNPTVEHFEPVRRAMYYGYFRGLEPLPGPAAEFHFRGNRLVYVFPTDGDLTLVASSIPIEDFEAYKKDLPASFAAEIDLMPELRPRFMRAERIGPLMGSATIPGYRKVPFGDGWALAGDAEQVMDPWSGQGIDQASTHATMLADALLKWYSGSSTWISAMTEYHKRRNDFSLKTYERTCMIARDLRMLTGPALKKRGLAKG